MTSTPFHDTSNMPRRWPWFLIGISLFLLGPILTFVQFGVLDRLATPWQLPILATLGVLCMLLSVLQRGGFVRISAFLLFAFVSGFAWYLFLFSMNTPLYAGPANPGTPLPAFQGKLANGQPFASADLAKGQSSVLLFFRGHW
jgi:hypothetical protein